MMQLRSLCYLFFVVVLFNSCNSAWCDCLDGSGSTSQELRTYSNETAVYIRSAFDVYLLSDTVNKIIIEGGSKLLHNVKIDSDSSSLYITNRNVCDWARAYENIKLYIHTKSLTQFYNQSPSRLYTIDSLKSNSFQIHSNSPLSSADLTLSCDRLDFQVWNGSGKFVLRGKCSTFSSNLGGSGCAAHVFADSLAVNNAYLSSRSTGNYHVNVSDYLEVSLLWKGDIYYKGSPKVKIDTVASNGRLVKNMEQ